MPVMQAAVFKGNGVLEVEQVEVPKLREPDQVLIKVRAASICGSDIHALHVPPGQVISSNIIMGHEFFGTVVEAGEKAHGYKAGDCVVVNPCLPCGECWECKHGMSNLCVYPRHYGQTCDGGFAEYALVEASQIYHVPADIHPDTAAQTEPLACIMCGMDMVKPTPTEHVLLYGVGPIGLTFIKVLKIFGINHLAVVAKGQARMDQARKCGANLVIDMQDGTVAETLEAQWGCKADVVIDAVGTGTVLAEAVQLVNSRGIKLRRADLQLCAARSQRFGEYAVAGYVINQQAFAALRRNPDAICHVIAGLRGIQVLFNRMEQPPAFDTHEVVEVVYLKR